jgi:ABC-2 type transport system ATP-binding protein
VTEQQDNAVMQPTQASATALHTNGQAHLAAAEQPAGPLIVEARNVDKRFGRVAVLDNLTLTVEAGEIFGLIGPSGSGKTTTIHLFCGHLEPSGGTVRVLGENPVSFSSAARRRIGYMPQNFVLPLDLTIKQNMGFAAGLYGLSEWGSRKRIRETLELVELWDARKRSARNASGGMLRRLALAATLVHDPDLIFADEPTANLDPILRAKLWRHFRSLSASGRTLLLTTQYIDEAEYCDRVGLMYDGMLIADGKPNDLRRRAFGGDVVAITLGDKAASAAYVVARVPGVRGTESTRDGTLRVTVESADRAIPALLDALDSKNIAVQSIAQVRATFDEVFIRLIEQHGEGRPALGRLRTSAADMEDTE